MITSGLQDKGTKTGTDPALVPIAISNRLLPILYYLTRSRFISRSVKKALEKFSAFEIVSE
jgi:hypothetical protein